MQSKPKEANLTISCDEDDAMLKVWKMYRGFGLRRCEKGLR